MSETALDQPKAPAAEQSAEGQLWKDYLKAAVIAVGLALIIRTFIVQAFKIPSESMVDTLLVGDHLLVNKLVYNFEPIQRGDIVVFRYPLDPNRDFVKRVVGLPGETIEMRQTTVYVNGAPLTESYTRYEDYAGYRHGFGPFTVPEGAVFMMGDNRDNSQDSRVWGPLPVENIRGKAFVIHWSWKDEGWGVRWNRVARLLD